MDRIKYCIIKINKMNELLAHTTIWMDLKGLRLSKNKKAELKSLYLYNIYTTYDNLC